MDVAVLLHTGWLVPVLALLVAIDGPFPVVPSEPLLMTASAVAIGSQDVPMTVGLVAAALVGSIAGDHLLFALGRTSRQFFKPKERGVELWVRRNLTRRPAMTIVGARFVPGGRLVSTTAAGRYGLRLHRFSPCSVASSVLWAAYIVGIGLLVGPFTQGDPLRGLLVGCVTAVLISGTFALVGRLRRGRSGAGPAVAAEEVPDQTIGRSVGAIGNGSTSRPVR